MANEAKVRTNLTVKKNNLDWKSSRTEFTADISATNPGGPSPGTVIATQAGTDVNLSVLSNPSLCEIENNDNTEGNYVTIGIYDGTEFYPLMEILPGEKYVIRLSRMLGLSIGAGAGTGTHDAGTYTLRFKSALGDANCNMMAFDR